MEIDSNLGERISRLWHLSWRGGRLSSLRFASANLCRRKDCRSHRISIPATCHSLWFTTNKVRCHYEGGVLLPEAISSRVRDCHVALRAPRNDANLTSSLRYTHQLQAQYALQTLPRT